MVSVILFTLDVWCASAGEICDETMRRRFRWVMIEKVVPNYAWGREGGEKAIYVAIIQHTQCSLSDKLTPRYGGLSEVIWHTQAWDNRLRR